MLDRAAWSLTIYLVGDIQHHHHPHQLPTVMIITHSLDITSYKTATAWFALAITVGPPDQRLRSSPLAI